MAGTAHEPHRIRARLPDQGRPPRYRAAGARVAIIEDGGHSLNVERPQEVAELIRDFLC